jgi:cyclopropane fatty-acyl-phospholipid synthase-like methyltransferase
MDLIARKLKLEPGMRVLDIGCGFGTLGYYLAKNYGVEVVGCSISKEQTKYGIKLCEGLPVKFQLCDYRELNEKFDRVVSVGMVCLTNSISKILLYKIFFQSLSMWEDPTIGNLWKFVAVV